MFLYKEVLKTVMGAEAKRAKHTKRLPVVLTPEEAGELLRAAVFGL